MRQTSAFFLLLALFSCSSPGSEVAIRVVSTQPHLVSGGDALIEVVTSVASGDELQLAVNGESRAVEFALTKAPDGSPSYRALVSGLRIGENTIAVDASGGGAQIAVVNYPITGPIISGRHLEPYFCLSELSPASNGEKRRFAVGNGKYLDDTPLDASCSLPTRVDYVYRSTTPDVGFLPLPDAGPLCLLFHTRLWTL